MSERYKIEHYKDDNGKDIYKEWLKNLRDQQGKAAIFRAVDRMEDGNFGEHRFCRDGVWELVINHGPGYRVYYSVIGTLLVLLLCGGSKRSQDRDIGRAVAYLRKYKEENIL